jgi:hypothetical protein
MDFKSFFFGLSVTERDSFAARANTSRGLLTQVAYGNKQVELGLGDVLVALAGGAVSLDEIPLTDNAKRQRAIRQGGGQAAVARPSRAKSTRAAASESVWPTTQQEVDRIVFGAAQPPSAPREDRPCGKREER